MKRLTHAMLVVMTASAVTSITLSAQAKPAAQTPAKPAAQAPAPPAPVRLSAPIKGEASIQVTKPATGPVKNNMVTTTVKVKNVSPGAIAGLRVQEFWYDKSRENIVTGNEERLRTPLQPGQTHTFTLNTPYNKAMDTNTYVFSHANGKIATKQVAKIE